MNKPDPRALAPASKLPKRQYNFNKNNKPDGKYLVYEIWEDKHPDKVIGGQKLDNFDQRTFSEEQLDKMIPFWKKRATDSNLKNPIVTIQGDIGVGCFLAYGYTDGRKEIPPNAKCYSVKPIFDENIMKIRHAGKQGKSLVCHSRLDSPTLREELLNFNKLLMRFFAGEYIDSDYKNVGYEFRREVVVDNAKLKNKFNPIYLLNI